ncbi:MAG: hypothetical protein M3N57_05700 [Actinomycetota bacterium]|nr:hypothetical protein [Actinomycetota bacterium]
MGALEGGGPETTAGQTDGERRLQAKDARRGEGLPVLGGDRGLSTTPYTGRLGFYSDDWDFLAILANAEDGSLPGLVAAQIELGTNLHMRPTQIVYQAVLHRLFGMHPLGYHLVNTAVLVAVALLLYRVLRGVGTPLFAVAVPAIYILAPNAATNRFWFAAFGYSLSIALYLVSLHADLRAATAGGRGRWRWKLLGVGALVAAGLGYEAVLPLVALNVVLAELAVREMGTGGLRGRMTVTGTVAFHGSTLAAVAGVVTYKAAVASGLGLGSPVFEYTIRLVSGALATNFGTYGAAFLHTVAWALPHAGAGGVVASLIVAISTYWYLGALAETSLPAPAYRGGGVASPALLGVGGLTVFVLGYAIFFTTGRIGFSSTGIANRVSAVAAVGAAMAIVALIGMVAGWVSSTAIRERLFRATVAAVCAAGVLVTNGLASFWMASWNRQQGVLAHSRRTTRLGARVDRAAAGSLPLRGTGGCLRVELGPAGSVAGPNGGIFPSGAT